MKAPAAQKVEIAGSFNRWEAESNPLSGPDDDGVWGVIIPLPDGNYEYLFLIDGERWTLDPAVPGVDDGLGGKNSEITITHDQVFRGY